MESVNGYCVCHEVWSVSRNCRSRDSGKLLNLNDYMFRWKQLETMGCLKPEELVLNKFFQLICGKWEVEGGEVAKQDKGMHVTSDL